ncbi:hypothetical protein [Bradyrhizobium cytisi]|uniref:Uncharacterized protein n=1 Tax=Bradyrhizobium cytisi TaxID=515489 RepID=A0A5S4VXA5_9BRAD|nr:hypothetical protein [Bradyrhizobium cytisi]TYL70449.1 hypothetical protein FXB38_41575 [Bradyrhizobium cytisi]
MAFTAHSTSDLDRHFQALWHRACNASSLGALTPELIQLWATERGLDVTSVEEREVGIFARTPAVVLAVGDIKACFPKIQPTGDPSWEARRLAAEAKATLWEKMEWFSPFWIPRDKTEKILADARLRTREQAIQLFNYHTSTLYTLAYEGPLVDQDGG